MVPKHHSSSSFCFKHILEILVKIWTWVLNVKKIYKINKIRSIKRGKSLPMATVIGRCCPKPYQVEFSFVSTYSETLDLIVKHSQNTLQRNRKSIVMATVARYCQKPNHIQAVNPIPPYQILLCYIKYYSCK